MDIVSPGATEDRHIECQEALEAAFRELVDHAVLSGWTEAEVLVALIELADNHMLANQARQNDETIIEMLRRMT